MGWWSICVVQYIFYMWLRKQIKEAFYFAKFYYSQNYAIQLLLLR